MRFKGKEILATSFPACSMPFDEIPVESPQKILTFKFRARASRFGNEFRIPGVQQIGGNIWRAGGEPDGLLLGVSSFSTADRILLNTLHFAAAQKRTESGLADGLVITTFPVRDAMAKNAR